MKLCRSVIQINAPRIQYLLAKQMSKGPDQVHVDTGPTFIKSLCNPLLRNEEIEKMNSIIGLNIGLTFIAWARLETKETMLTHLDYVMLPENINKMDPNDIYFLAYRILKSLPEADRYVMESVKKSFVTTGGHLRLTLQATRFQMVSTIATLLNSMQQNEAESCAVIFLKQLLTGKLFDLLIGNEMISCKHTVMELLTDEFVGQPTNAPVCHVKTPEQVVTKYKKAPDVGKELMGRAFLEALTFKKLIIDKDSKCFKRIQGRMRFEANEKSAA